MQVHKSFRKIFLYFAGVTAVVSLLVWLLTVYGEQLLLRSVIVPYAGTQLGVWIDDFMLASSHVLWISVVGALGWFLLTSLALRVSDWKSAGKRLLWIGVFASVVTVSTVYGFYYVPSTQSGGSIAYLFFAANSAAIYYFSTVLASPPAYKYTPVGAEALRFL